MTDKQRIEAGEVFIRRGSTLRYRFTQRHDGIFAIHRFTDIGLIFEGLMTRIDQQGFTIRREVLGQGIFVTLLFSQVKFVSGYIQADPVTAGSQQNQCTIG